MMVYYGLCPSKYLRAPGLSRDAMLKMTKTEPGLIPDPDKAYNKYIKSYDPKQ